MKSEGERWPKFRRDGGWTDPNNWDPADPACPSARLFWTSATHVRSQSPAVNKYCAETNSNPISLNHPPYQRISSLYLPWNQTPTPMLALPLLNLKQLLWWVRCFWVTSIEMWSFNWSSCLPPCRDLSYLVTTSAPTANKQEHKAMRIRGAGAGRVRSFILHADLWKRLLLPSYLQFRSSDWLGRLFYLIRTVSLDWSSASSALVSFFIRLSFHFLTHEGFSRMLQGLISYHLFWPYLLTVFAGH